MTQSRNSKQQVIRKTPHLRLLEDALPKPLTDRETALQLLRACVATEVRCMAEVVRYASSTPNVSRTLIENILAVEEEHATELMGILRSHRVAT